MCGYNARSAHTALPNAATYLPNAATYLPSVQYYAHVIFLLVFRRYLLLLFYLT